MSRDNPHNEEVLRRMRQQAQELIEDFAVAAINHGRGSPEAIQLRDRATNYYFRVIDAYVDRYIEGWVLWGCVVLAFAAGLALGILTKRWL